jgi:hypothetical protein
LPRRVITSSAFGPTTAIDFTSRESGRMPSFLSSTIEACAIRRARRACSGDSFTEYGICA